MPQPPSPSLRSRFGLFLLLCGAVAAVLAAWMVYVPAGVAVLAFVLIVAGYALLYVEARNASDRQPASEG